MKTSSVRILKIIKCWRENAEDFIQTIDIKSPDDIRKIMDMLGDVGDEITYFVTNPSTPLYCISELDKNQRILKETRILGNSLVFEQGKNEWRELLNPALSEFLDRLLKPAEVIKKNIVEEVLRALADQEK